MSKTNYKLQQGIFMALNYAGFMAAGICLARFLFAIEDKVGHELTGFSLFYNALIALILIFVPYIIHICLHECGHVIFGLMSGYRFGSLRFFNVILYKSNDKLKLGIYKMGGTAGQALLLPPEGDPYNYPTTLYNLGGLIVNLILVAISAIAIPFVDNPYLDIFFVGSVVMGLTLFVTNALPFTVVGVDGANTILFTKSAAARKVFHDSLIMTAMLADGKAISDIPEEYLTFDWTTELDNPLACSSACNDIALSELKRDFAEVERKVDIILNCEAPINILHKGTIIGQKIYAMIMLDRPTEDITRFFKDNQKELKMAATLLDHQRHMYAYYSLVEIDGKKADKCTKTFDNIAKNYPYPSLVEDEREFINLVDEKKAL